MHFAQQLPIDNFTVSDDHQYASFDVANVGHFTLEILDNPYKCILSLDPVTDPVGSPASSERTGTFSDHDTLALNPGFGFNAYVVASDRNADNRNSNHSASDLPFPGQHGIIIVNLNLNAATPATGIIINPPPPLCQTLTQFYTEMID